MDARRFYFNQLVCNSANLHKINNMVSSWQSFINKRKERCKMQKYITRTVDYTKIRGFLAQIGGDNEKNELPPIDVAGKLNEDKAIKLFRKKYGYNTIVTGIEYSSELRRMTIEDFIVNSEKVN